MKINLKDILIFIFDFFSITLMVNAPNILVGYGLIIAAMMTSIIFTRPVRGATLFLISHILATIFLAYTASIFLSVSILSLIVRSLVVYTLAFLYEKNIIENTLVLLTSIVILDGVISYSIALSYYGYDAIEVGLDIYSAVYIPFIYLAKSYYEREKLLYVYSIFVDMLLYYFTSSYFYALPLNILSILIILYFIKPFKYEKTKKILYTLPLIFIVLLPISLTPLTYNLKVTLYPYEPRTISGNQWMQLHIQEHCKAGNVFEHVYDPSRLRIIDTCVTIEGVVVSNIHKYSDGDICFDIMPDPQYRNMLSIGSIVLRHGAVHVEIVPHDQPNVTIPHKGDRVRVTGVWVVDTDHGSYSEIHPTWRVEILSYNSTY